MTSDRRHPHTALFWDIDGTLLTTARAGVFSLEAALAQLTGVSADLQEMETAGLTDYAIAERALASVGHATDEETVQRFLRVHGDQLPAYLHLREGHVMPGVLAVLEDLAKAAGVRTLLLTGNTESGARAKLVYYGLDRFFQEGGAFCSGPGERTEIARRAVDLADGANIVYVIGDTPADVVCGNAIGARTIAVATGTHSVDALAACAPWAVLETIPEPGQFRRLIELEAA